MEPDLGAERRHDRQGQQDGDDDEPRPRPTRAGSDGGQAQHDQAHEGTRLVQREDAVGVPHGVHVPRLE